MKNKILYFVNMVDIFFLGLFISCMDSANITIPAIGIVICAAWLLIYHEFNKCFTWNIGDNRYYICLIYRYSNRTGGI